MNGGFYKYILLVIIVAAAFAGGFAVRTTTSITTSTTTATAGGGDFLKYSLINQAVTANLDKYFIINFKLLREQLEKIQKNYSPKSYIYFLYLNNGSWAGFNERENFTAASTVKIPLAMALFKAVEDKKVKLDDSYTLENLDLDTDFGDLYKVGGGNSFTVEEFVKIMLENSDNTAKNAILNVLNGIGISNPLADVYQFFGWTFDLGQAPDTSKINLRTLSNMFLALYNAKYVNIEYSQKILEYLNNSPFNGGIAAGIPKRIAVAHKIGVSADDETFSDCGIVYAPSRHYILCLGSSGGSEEKANIFMQEVSRTVYDYVVKN